MCCRRVFMRRDLALALIGRIGTAGASGHTIEYLGAAVQGLSMEGRMTLCNLSIEAGARAGLVAVDEATLEYVHGRPFAPKGELWDAAESFWRGLVSDAEASFDREANLDASALAPQVTWGTSPEMVAGRGRLHPEPGPSWRCPAGGRNAEGTRLHGLGGGAADCRYSPGFECS